MRDYAFVEVWKAQHRRISMILGITLLCSPIPYSVQAEDGVSNTMVQIVTQAKTVKGTVLDENGEPLIGVSIVVKGTSTGTITDFDGKFSIDLPAGSKELLISYIGYKDQTITITGNAPLNVKMVPDTQALDEVVVIGYGTVKKRDLTGAVTSVKSGDITVSPVNNPMEALQGKVAGLDIMKSSGKAGADVDIQLRGTRSIYGSNSPLFIIDGIQGSYNQVNPADIESIEVLKDASSTAIYGSAGANGVVIITTKQGKTGKATVNFDAYVGVSGFAKFPHGMTGDEYVNLKKEAWRTKNNEEYPEFMSTIFNKPGVLEAYEAGKWIDWVDEVMGKNGVQQNYNLSITGGTEKTKIFASLNYNNEEGLIENDNRKRYSMRLNLDQSIFSWAKVGFNTNLTYTDGNSRNQGVFVNALTFLPLGDAYDADGNINYEYCKDGGKVNPMADEAKDQYVNNTRSTYFTGNAYLELTPLKGLTFKSVLGTTLSNSRNGVFFGEKSIANITSGYQAPLAEIYNSASYAYRWENVITYNFTLARDHNFGVTGITSWSKNQDEANESHAQGQELAAQSFHNLGAGTEKVQVASSFSQTQSMSYAFRLNYSYKGKYLFTFSNRWDGVSHLAVGHKWDAFPAAAIGWRISDEAFMEKTQNWLSNLKLRAGYGVTGNSGRKDAAYSSTTGSYTYPKGVGFGNSAAGHIQYGGTYGNPDVGWEKSYNTNIGIDLGLFNGRVNFTFDWYNTDTKDLLYARTMPITSGIAAWGSPMKAWQNLGETNNKGIELSLNTQNIVKKNFTWSSNVTFTANKEKIVSLPDGDVKDEKLFEGEAISVFYDYKYLGIWSTTEAEEAAKYNCKPGDIKLATDGSFNDNGIHTYSNKTDYFILGKKTPDWILGFQNNFTYRDFDLSFFIMARWGYMVNNDVITRYNPTTSWDNSPTGSDYWTPENQGAYLPRPGLHDAVSNYTGFTSLGYMDGSYIKVKNITLGYSLPKKWLSKICMEKLRVYATAYDPFIFAKEKLMRDLDPERNGASNFPLTKRFVFGVNVTF